MIIDEEQTECQWVKACLFRQTYRLKSFEVMTRKIRLGQARTQFSNSMAIGISLKSLPDGLSITLGVQW
jgi:hypothetical protein